MPFYSRTPPAPLPGPGTVISKAKLGIYFKEIAEIFFRKTVTSTRWAVGITAIIALGPTFPVPATATAAIESSASANTHIEPTWQWPLAPPHVTQKKFEAPPHPYAPGHRGIDITAVPGTNITAPSDGHVFFSGYVVDRPVITIDHGDGLRSSFEPVESSLPPGTPVQAGEVIGTVGGGGHCDNSCIHLGVRLHGNYISPELLLAHIERAVLLPLTQNAP